MGAKQSCTKRELTVTVCTWNLGACIVLPQGFLGLPCYLFNSAYPLPENAPSPNHTFTAYLTFPTLQRRATQLSRALLWSEAPGR